MNDWINRIKESGDGIGFILMNLFAAAALLGGICLFLKGCDVVINEIGRQ